MRVCVRAQHHEMGGRAGRHAVTTCTGAPRGGPAPVPRPDGGRASRATRSGGHDDAAGGGHAPPAAEAGQMLWLSGTG